MNREKKSKPVKDILRPNISRYIHGISVEELLKLPNDLKENKPIRISEAVAQREKLKNQNISVDIKLKVVTLIFLLLLLLLETGAVFVFAFFQATGKHGFHLDGGSFNILVGATISQIYLMLRVAIEYLFPKKHK